MYASMTFDLPKLRILFLSCDFRDGTTIKLQTPSLTAFKCESQSDYEIAHPESLIYLEASYADLKFIQQLVNLERLYCYKIVEYEPVLDKLLKLKEIHTRDQHIEIFLRLDEDRASSGRGDLRFSTRESN